MIKRLLSLFLCCACLSAFGVHAEGGCPPGQYPQQGQGWQSCVPIPGNNQAANTDPAPVYYNSWQAVATDTAQGVFGTSVGIPERFTAEDQALKDCKAKGGTNCQVQVSYKNGCVAMALGDKTLRTQGAPTKKKAEESTMDNCRADGNTTCEVYYSECSPIVK